MCVVSAAYVCGLGVQYLKNAVALQSNTFMFYDRDIIQWTVNWCTYLYLAVRSIAFEFLCDQFLCSPVMKSFMVFMKLLACYHFMTYTSANPDAKRLYDDLLSTYNRLIRPVSNNTETVLVKLGLRLSQLIDLVRSYF